MAKKNNKVDIISKTKHIIDKYNIDVYGFKLYVAYHANTEQIKKVIPKFEDNLNDVSYDACTLSRVVDNEGDNSILVVINDIYTHSNTNKASISAHEALHATYSIMNFIHSNLTTDTQEPYAYLLEYITKCIYTTWTKD